MSRNFSQRDFDDLLDRHARNLTTPAEDKLLEAWLETFHEKERTPGMEEQPGLKMEVWNGIEEQINTAKKQRFILSHAFSLSVAATVLVLIAAGIFIFLNNNSQSSFQPILSDINVEWREVKNSGTKTMKVELADGSQVLLSPNSVLQSAITTASAERIVKLNGEAFFDVAHDKKRAFVVLSEQIVTRVLGTKFLVSAQGPKDKVSVVVTSGRVAVSNPNRKSEVILVADQEVVYDPLDNSFAQNTIEKTDDATTTQRLAMIFEEEPVSNILRLLAEKYSVDISYDAELLENCLVTTAFSEEGLYERLTITAKIIGATYTIQHGKVIFKSTGCN